MARPHLPPPGRRAYAERMSNTLPPDPRAIARRIKTRGKELGFQAIGITDIDLGAAELRLLNWLDAGRHGDMEYMARHGTRRSRPADLIPGTIRVISARMDYLPPDGREPWSVIDDPELGYVSRYALGRDYHKLLRKRLAQLARTLTELGGEVATRAFSDSAPVLEKALAAKAGLGWIGKHSNLLSRDAGSWFFLGEVYTDLALPVDTPVGEHCGDCRRCLDACPTGAIVAPYQVDARLCISYLTIELHGPIPLPLRPLMGNRIYGCDDCQLVCPWNRFASPTPEGDFLPRHGLDAPALLALFAWSEAEFLRRTEGSPIRRIGHQRWLRNIAVALGNAPPTAAIRQALTQRLDDSSPLVREHIAWALQRQQVATHDPSGTHPGPTTESAIRP